MPRQFEIGDDSRIEQAHRVRGDRIRKTGRELFGYRCAADDGILFQNDDRQPSACEICGGRQPVMAAADNRNVKARIGHHEFQRRKFAE